MTLREKQLRDLPLHRYAVEENGDVEYRDPWQETRLCVTANNYRTMGSPRVIEVTMGPAVGPRVHNYELSTEKYDREELEAYRNGTHEEFIAQNPTRPVVDDSPLHLLPPFRFPDAPPACGARDPQIAGGNPCILDQGHTGEPHVSIFEGRGYTWFPGGR